MAEYDDGQQRSPFLVPPLPEEVIRNARTTDKRTGGGTENVVETAERKGVRDDIDTLEADHQRAMDQKLAHDEATSLINQQHADAALELHNQQLADRDKAYKATQVGIDEWRGRLRESMDRYDKAPAPKLWAEGATDNLLKGIGLALAGIGDAVTTRALITAGHAPTGKNTVSDLIDSEMARQRENIARLSDRVVTAKTGFADAQQARAQLLAEVDQRASVLFKRADLVAQSRLAGQGMDAAKIQATLDQLGWRQKSLAAKQDSVAPLINHITENHQDAVGTEHSDTKNINAAPKDAGQGRWGVVRNPDGTANGTSPAGEANETNEQTQKRMQAKEAVTAFYDFAKAHPRVSTELDPEAYKTMNALHATALEAVTGISYMGKSDETNAITMKRLGPSGTGVWSASPDVIKRVLDANEHAMHESIKMHTAKPGAVGNDGQPVTAAPAGAPTASPSVAAQSSPVQISSAAPPAPAAPEETREQVLRRRAIEQLRANPNLPNAETVKKRLKITDAELR